MQTNKMPATMQPILETERLILRPRTMEDLDHVTTMNSDPEVMRHIAPVGTAFMSMALRRSPVSGARATGAHG
ncbi:hypothetical protein FG93_05372 [Bosea sp. LC85]|uniref:GNAT family N-acetyltransferase n=1 Tax=Bosea sp. LC85 TaxID=1502851 RepID=UPI0004E319C0|nr:GNAT family N-acetyltransferase [Bosea sp. LC85]KFC63863.1 hypothetical protein FG93_05372 [Bosea sp. LC85]